MPIYIAQLKVALNDPKALYAGKKRKAHVPIKEEQLVCACKVYMIVIMFCFVLLKILFMIIISVRDCVVL